MLAQTPKHPPGPDRFAGGTDLPPTLASIGIDKKLSAVSQRPCRCAQDGSGAAIAFGQRRRIAGREKTQGTMDIPLSQVTEATLEQLIADGEREGKRIEYKQALSVEQSDQIKKFLASVASFANASGGDLIYGMRAVDGVPMEITPLIDFNFDQVQLRLDQLMRSGIEPKIPGIEFHEVTCDGGSVLVMRIPKTYAGPHFITFGGENRFYARSAAGKVPMDRTEIKSAFTLADTALDKVRRWRMDRIAQILADEGPCRLKRPPRVVLHFIPLRSFDPAFRADLSILGTNRQFLIPIGGYGSPGIDFDGAFSYMGANQQSTEGYTYVLRNGCIETVSNSIFSDYGDERVIPSAVYEERLYSFLPTAFQLLKQIGNDVPVFIALSLLNVQGYTMAMSAARWNHSAVPINRNHLYLPEIFLESFQVKPAELLRDSFNMIWNACGWQKSPNFDSDGKWKPAPG